MKYLREIIFIFLHFGILDVSFAQSSRPHIIFIYADDLGWNDVSFHGSPEIPTPNVDALAMSGILLNNYYGQQLCTPSRASLLSGKYPIRLGLQHDLLKIGEASALPLGVVTLPQHLKRLGYETHMIGKWHLGYQTKEYTPIYRGFDTFFGFYNGYIDYYDYTNYEPTEREDVQDYYCIDIQNGTKILRGFRGRYATEVFTGKATDIIRKHDVNQPLFLYLAHAAVHTGLPMKPWLAPAKYVNQVSYIKNMSRRLLAATMLALDDSVGRIFQDLDRKNMLQNTIFMFVSDNGGDVNQLPGASASNYPLRGQKGTLFEGGVRLPALIWSPLLKLKEPRISKKLMDVTDWLPTLYRAAGGNLKDLGSIDGLNMWETFTQDLPSPRHELLYNIDPIIGNSALRRGNFKVLNGSQNSLNSWYRPTPQLTSLGSPDESLNDWVFKFGSRVPQILIRHGWWINEDPNDWRKNAVVTCDQPPPVEDLGGCHPTESPCLFDIDADPCEYKNIASQHPEIVQDLMNIIYEYQESSVPPQSKPSDSRANPVCHNFGCVPWLDPEHYVPYCYL